MTAGSGAPSTGRHIRFMCRLLAAVCLGVILLASPSSEAAFRFNDSDWEGTSQLLALAQQHLGSSRVRVIAAIEYDQLKAEDALLVMHPEKPLDRIQMSRFLLAGGRVALLDDYGSGLSLLEHFQMRRIRAPLRPAMTLRDNTQLAVAVPAETKRGDEQLSRHPIVSSVEHLVTNHPTGLIHKGLTPVLLIPATGEEDVTLAVTGVIAGEDSGNTDAGGRLLVMGDPSALINLMMRYPGNRQFAVGLVDYLLERSGRSTQGTLYMVSNEFDQTGAFGGQNSVNSWLESRVNSLRTMSAGLLERGLPGWMAFAIAAALAVAVAAWTLLTSTHGYSRVPPRFATGLPLVAQSGAAGRTAVLSAPTTHRSLAVLELKSAIHEGMAQAVDMPVTSTLAVLQRELDTRGALGASSRAKLTAFLAELRGVEERVVAARPPRISTRQLKMWHKTAMRLVAEMTRSKGIGL